MNTRLFRKSSIDRVNSPEQLNEYIRVANPSVWLVLAAVIALLVGVLIWGIFGTVQTTVETGALVSEGEAVCYVSEQDARRLTAGMSVTVGDVSGSIRSIDAVPAQMDGAYAELGRHIVGFTQDGLYYGVHLQLSGLADGVYPAVITVESIHPISFILH